MGQVGAHLLDTVTRIYKNSDGKVIGLHCIGVHEHRDASPAGVPGDYPTLAERRRRSLHISDSFQRFNLDIGGSRVIDTVLMLGKYDDFTVNGSGNDLSDITYEGKDDEGLVNDFVIGLGEYPTVGDTL